MESETLKLRRSKRDAEPEELITNHVNSIKLDNLSALIS